MNRYQEIQKMLTEQPDDDFLHYALALEYINMGQVKEGLIILENLREKSPGYLGLYHKLGNLYNLAGQKEKAIEVFEAGVRLAEDLQQFKTRDELKSALQMIKDEEWD
jgi:tetratricopeptide (TPR) repeat protein